MMKIIARLTAFGAAAFAMVGMAMAMDFGDAPADYEDQARTYVESRLEDPRAARFQTVGEPYQIYADVAGYEALPGWGVDVRVKSRLPSGSYGATESLTVIFIEGEPVALEEDAQRIARL